MRPINLDFKALFIFLVTFGIIIGAVCICIIQKLLKYCKPSSTTDISQLQDTIKELQHKLEESNLCINLKN